MERGRQLEQNQDGVKGVNPTALSRRSLLKGMLLTAAAWGLGSEFCSQEIEAALAAPARRKYALLIGIDKYSDEGHCPDLRGCLNDLELQRNLLVHRFGFQSDDIVVLKNKQASRSAVQGAFLNHLLAQVTAEDVVFIHFSGYGSQAQVEEGGEVQRTLVLHDSCGYGEGMPIRDLPESTLLMVLRALPTDRVVSVLDTGHHIPEESPVSEGVNLRSRPSPTPAEFDAETLAFQAILQEKIDARGILPSSSKSMGVIVQTTDWINAALEFEGQAGFVGLMTYVLSQQLWRSPGQIPWRVVMAEASGRLADELDSLQSIRLLDGLAPSRSLYKSGLEPQGETDASGVILAARNSNDIDLWLGGLSSTALSYSAAGSVFVVLPALPEVKPPEFQLPGTENPPEPVYLQISQRNGLRAEAKQHTGDSSTQVPVVGSFIQEQVRVVPQNVELAIAIDQRLDRIERVDATSALTSIPNLSVVALHNQPADYIFGRVQPNSPTLVASLTDNEASSSDAFVERSVSDIPETPDLVGNQYGLLTLGREILPATVGASAEAIKTAVQRLQPHLETLRAAKNIEVLENGLTTQLPLQNRWEVLPNGGSGSPIAVESASASGQIPLLKLSSGDRLRYTLKNNGDRPLYSLVLSFDPRGNWRPVGTEHLTTPIAPGAINQNTLDLGQRSGITELYLLCSIAPFSAAYQYLSYGNQRSPDSVAEQPIVQPYRFSQTILQDLSQASQMFDLGLNFSGNVYPLNLMAWAGFRQSCFL